jgi:hypothetical protein
MDMDHSGLLEKQGNLNLSRRLSRDGDRIGTGERSGEGTTQPATFVPAVHADGYT